MKAKIFIFDSVNPDFAILGVKIARSFVSHLCDQISYSLVQRKHCLIFKTKNNYFGRGNENIELFKNFFNANLDDIKNAYKDIKSKYLDRFIFDDTAYNKIYQIENREDDELLFILWTLSNTNAYIHMNKSGVDVMSSENNELYIDEEIFFDEDFGE
jgi:hypothetical protein